jgi:hypothetical protein
MLHLVVSIMWDIGCAMEQIADAMPTVRSNDLVLMFMTDDMLADDVSNLTISYAGPHMLDRPVQGLASAQIRLKGSRNNFTAMLKIIIKRFHDMI